MSGQDTGNDVIGAINWSAVTIEGRCMTTYIFAKSMYSIPLSYCSSGLEESTVNIENSNMWYKMDQIVIVGFVLVLGLYGVRHLTHWTLLLRAIVPHFSCAVGTTRPSQKTTSHLSHQTPSIKLFNDYSLYYSYHTYFSCFP